MELTLHVTIYPYMFMLQSYMTFRFHGGAGLSVCHGQWAQMLSVGRERNKYRHL